MRCDSFSFRISMVSLPAEYSNLSPEIKKFLRNPTSLTTVNVGDFLTSKNCLPGNFLS